MALVALGSSLLALPSGATAAGDDGDRERLERGEVIVSGDVDQARGVGCGQATALIEAPPARVFRVVTGYEAYPDFMPYVVESRVLKREGADAIVRARARAAGAPARARAGADPVRRVRGAGSPRPRSAGRRRRPPPAARRA